MRTSDAIYLFSRARLGPLHSLLPVMVMPCMM